MNTLKPVRLLVPWQAYSKGHVFPEMPAAQAQVMVAAGQAEYCDKQMPSPVDRMMRPEVTVKRRPGRPRKNPSAN